MSISESCKGNNLFCDIEAFNKMYKLEKPTAPTWLAGRLKDFGRIIQEEVDEGGGLVTTGDRIEIELLTNLSDWLGDIVIYCLSEMLRWGLDPETILRIIMQSNFSKLGADGEPIYDDRGKVMKGPGYWKPEPALKDYIMSRIEGAQSDV